MSETPMPHFDWQKVWGLLTEAEARRTRKLIKQKKDGAVRSIIINAMRRAETMPLSEFVKTDRERIVFHGNEKPKSEYKIVTSRDQEDNEIIHEMGQ